jgi:phospholipase C
MRHSAGFLLGAALMLGSAQAQITNFQHVVLIVQENRTPDNLFYALCATSPCSTNPDSTQYDIQTTNWLTTNGTIQPQAAPLADVYDLEHKHSDFVSMCDFDSATASCKMDGAALVICRPKTDCPQNPQFKYVDNSKGLVAPYLFLATQYGWANYMFQTNQGPSFPAHQFLFGATSAPNADGDHAGTFMAENLPSGQPVNGCVAPLGTLIQLIDADGIEDPFNTIYPCVEHQTLSDLLDGESIAWRYYTPGAGDLWSAPDAITHICQPVNQQCTGAEWNQNVALRPSYALSDIAACNLRPASWIVPSAQFSDHAKINVGTGPAWVAAIVNAIGNSKCKNPDGSSYWDTTAIIVVWDDWGGWYDHEPPTFLPYPEGGYQYGFRVPMLFISAYTPAGFISNNRLDFGSIARFIEANFGITMGTLTFADQRATFNLAEFYDLSQAPRPFVTVPSPVPSAGEFVFSTAKILPPDDD